MNFETNPDLDPNSLGIHAAMQGAIETVTDRLLGGSVDKIRSALDREFIARGLSINNRALDEWARTLSEGTQLVLVNPTTTPRTE
jgi:hypothetical protein